MQYGFYRIIICQNYGLKYRGGLYKSYNRDHSRTGCGLFIIFWQIFLLYILVNNKTSTRHNLKLVLSIFVIVFFCILTLFMLEYDYNE